MNDGRDKHANTDAQYDVHEIRRDAAGREQYIAWRMQDVPGVYTALMPFTCDVRELWDAERALRRQYAEDQKMAASPWRRIGPRPQLLDYANLTGHDRMMFGLEIEYAPVYDGRIVKEGREDDPAVRAAVAEQQAKFESSGLKALWEERAAIMQRLKADGAESFEEGEVERLRARHTELVGLIQEIESRQ